MNHRKTRIILITLIAILVVTLVANLFWFSFIKSEAVAITEINKTIKEERAQPFNSVELKKRIIDLEDRNAQLNEIFIDRSNVVAFIEKIEGLAAERGFSVQIQNVDVSPVTVGEGEEEVQIYGLLDMTFRVNGSWDNVIGFLEEIQDQPHHINVESFRLISSNSNNGERVWSANFSIIGITN